MKGNARAAGAARFGREFSWDAWREQHLYGMVSSLGFLLRRLRASLLTVAVMALALLLPLLLQVLLQNLSGFGEGLRDAREMSAFLQPGLGADEAGAAADALTAVAGVARVHLRTPGDALEELRALEGFDGAATLLDDNPLPYVLIVAPRAELDDAGLRALATQVEVINGVAFVQFDLAWRDRLGKVQALAKRLAAMATVLFGLAALLVVGNTVRLDVAARAHEIAVVQSLGGSDAFVRRPFVYAGVWYGMAAGALAWACAAALVFWSRAPALALVRDYSETFVLAGVSPLLGLTTLAAGAMLGWIGAWIACSSWLARGRPR